MIYKDVAQYEESDSNLAKYTIMELQKEIKEWKKENQEKDKEITRLNNIKNKAIARIKEGIFSDEGVICVEDSEDLLNILEGEQYNKIERAYLDDEYIGSDKE